MDRDRRCHRHQPGCRGLWGHGFRKKPDLAIFRACLSALQVNAEDAVFVGDDFDADMKPSLVLGMRTVWKSPEGSTAVSFCSNSLSEIRAYLHGEA